MDEDEKVARFLETISQRVIHHHESLWEEEKHYTWWIYVIFGALLFIVDSQSISTALKVALVILGCTFGIFISMTGYRVVRKEGGYFYDAMHQEDNAKVALGLTKIKVESEPKALTTVSLSANPQPNKRFCDLVFGILRGGLGIRDLFQLTFVVGAGGFVIFALTYLAWVLWTLLR